MSSGIPAQPVDPGPFGKLVEQEGRAGNLDRFIRTVGHVYTAVGGRNRFPIHSPHGPDSLLYSTDDGTTAGHIQRYLVYNHLNQIVKRVDLIGPPHSGTPTPHTNEYLLHLGQYVTPSNRVRPAFQWEIP